MIKAKPFSLEQVRLRDGIFRDAMLRDQAFLLQIDPARLLRNFHLVAGLPTAAEPYGGWESPDCELRGHTVGHYLSACALMTASTGDLRFKERVDVIVTELGLCQDALPAQGYTPGFLSAYPETFFDRVERRLSIWAPYYTLHKILAGLLDAYTYCGNTQALGIVEKVADWIMFRIGRLTLEQIQIMLLNEPGGMNEILANLYGITGKPEHKALSLAFNDEVVLDPLARRVDQLDRLHANTQIPKAVGTARQYELTGEMRYRDISSFFWERVALHRSFVIGGNSDDELFFPVNRFSQHLSPVTAETCNTYNMLKLTHHLFSWEPSAQTMDFYERALFNHILGSQDPEMGMMLYFASLKPGHFKVYNSPEHSFWCCTGTGMENHAKYGEAIYAHDSDSLFVNLFIASDLRWDEKGLVVRQETRFPDQDTTRLTLHCQSPTRLSVKIRHPAWTDRLSITINGEDAAVQRSADGYVSLEREWRDGDRIDVSLPMRLSLEALPGTPDTVAVLYGPIVLAGALGTENMPGVYQAEMHTRESAVHRLPTPAVPALTGDTDAILRNIVPVTGYPLTFKVGGITLIPFYRLHHQRYTVYWQLH